MKFRDPDWTVAGQRRARVSLTALRTLWFNTGTRCNLDCRHCFMESSPTNDTLAWLTVEDAIPYFDEIGALGLPTQEIGFTGGEPFTNPHSIALLEAALQRDFKALVLTNGTRPMVKQSDALLELKSCYGDRLALRLSLDHYSRPLHEQERGDGRWEPAIAGLRWLADNGFSVTVAGRLRWGEPEDAERDGYGRLFRDMGIALDAASPRDLVLFAEMDPTTPTPEVSEACWAIVGRSPDMMMCATSRMVVKRRGEDRPSIVPCTLLPLDGRFDLGRTLRDAAGNISLNHPYCAQFCVLGGCACSG